MARKQGKRQGSKKSGKISVKEVITTHNNADFDALGSMIAVNKFYPGAALAFPGSQEKNLRNFFLETTSYLFNFIKSRQIDFDQVERLIIVDTRQKSRIGKFSELVGKKGVEIHLYDHHPASRDDIRGDLEHLCENGSTTSMITLMIQEKKMTVSPEEATIMCLGIHEDTGSFTFSSTTPDDYLAAAWLTEQGADHNTISDMLTRELTAVQVGLLNDLTQATTTRVINGVEVAFSKVITDEYIGDFAVLVHKLMDMGTLNVLFAMAQMKDRIYMVARSRIPDVNVGEIAYAMGGGGHHHASSVTFRNKTLIQVERSLQALLRSRIHPARKVRDLMTSPAITVYPGESLEQVTKLMTRYDINVILVVSKDGEMIGYVTRQVVLKAIHFGLGELRTGEYMTIEFSTIHPDAPLKEAQDLIIRDKVRILPVLEDGNLVGVVTRTDLLNILQGDPLIPDFVPDAKGSSHFMIKKNMSALLREMLPKKIIQYFFDIGHIADMMGLNVYLVGGLVRDVILKRNNLDVDIVVEGDGIKFAHEFALHHDIRVRSHRKFGTAVLIFPDGFKVDVASARMEYYESPGAQPVIETSSLKMDMYRRDFTINTLAIKLNKKDYGVLIDYFGALRDIKKKVLRVLHSLSFVEDPTRMLRVVRFEQRFNFKIGVLTRSLIKNASQMDVFKDFAGRRFFLELKMILQEPDPLPAIRRMHEFDLFQFIYPKIRLTENIIMLLEEIRRVIDWYRLLYLDERFEPWKIYWYGLTSSLRLVDVNEMAKKHGMVDIESRKMLSQRETVGRTLSGLYRFSGKNDGLYDMLSAYDTETQLYMMARANNEKSKKLISRYFMKLKGTKIQIKGKDLTQLGFQPGPVFKEVFEKVLKAKLNNLVKTKDDEIRFVKEHFL